jgi:xanthine/uracil permease
MMDRLKEILKENLKTNWLTLIGILFGGAGGYLYWLKIGCASGTCPITSSPVMTAVWGAILGGLLFGMFKRKGGKE